MLNKKFIAMHSGMQHSYQIALALQESEKLKYYITSIYYKKEQFPFNILDMSKKLKNILEKRRAEYLDDDMIKTISRYEFLEQIFRRSLGNKHFTTTVMPHWRDRKFDNYVANHFISDEISGIISFPNCSLETFKMLKTINPTSKCIIEQPIGYYKEAEKIFLEEKELHPEFSDSITFSNQSETFKNRIDEELKMSDNIFVASRFVKNTLVKNKIDEKKIVINPYGSFIAPISNIKYKKNEKFNILFVGQLSQRKGIKYLLEAVKKLKQENFNVHLTLVGKIYGSGNWMKYYDKTIDTYIAHTSRDNLKEIFQQSDIFVLPSLFEGSALVVYEALACGLPAIVSTNTGSDMIQDYKNGFTIPIRDSNAIVDKIVYLIDNPEKLNEMKEQALLNSHDMSWLNYRDRIKTFLSNIES